MSIQVSLNPLYAAKRSNVSATKWFWLLWLFAIAIVYFIISATLEFAPFLFVDELMNVDLGRVILDPSTDWSIAWMTDIGAPVFLLSYVGPVLQEIFYKALGELGPRYSALLGALAAATVMINLLLMRGVAKSTAFVLGLAFLLDPLFVQAYTTGRVDGWAIALCLLSCSLLRYAAFTLERTPKSRILILVSGGIAAIAVFTWISALLLFPLILLELVFLLKRSVALSGERKEIFMLSLLFSLGGLAACFLLLLPIVPQLFVLFKNIVQAISVNLQQGDGTMHQPYRLYLFSQFLELLRILKFTPFISITALIAAVSLREKGQIISIVLISFVILNTVVYMSRVQYLLPYFIVLISVFFKTGSHYSTKRKLLKACALGLILFWAVGLSLGARTSVALVAKEERDRNLVRQAALSMIGTGGYKVYTPYEFYYVGRAAGWSMYRSYLSFNATLSKEVLLKILLHVDYAIIEQPSKELESELMRDGWHDRGYLHLYDSPAAPYNGITTNDKRIRNLYHINRKPYGPYRVFVRGNIDPQ